MTAGAVSRSPHAAEIYALPWELLRLGSTHLLRGGITGLVIRYECPEAPAPPSAHRSTRRTRDLGANVLETLQHPGSAVTPDRD